jgi:hypothetical protein
MGLEHLHLIEMTRHHELAAFVLGWLVTSAFLIVLLVTDRVK